MVVVINEIPKYTIHTKDFHLNRLKEPVEQAKNTYHTNKDRAAQIKKCITYFLIPIYHTLPFKSYLIKPSISIPNFEIFHLSLWQ